MRPRLTFSLRASAIAFALFCVLLGISARPLRFMRAQGVIESLGGTVEWVKDGGLTNKNTGRLPLGQRYCRVTIDTSWRGGRDALQCLCDLHALQELEIRNAPGVADIEVIPLRRLRCLRTLQLSGVSANTIDAAAVASLESLGDLVITDAPVSTGALDVISRLPSLKSLALWDVAFEAPHKAFNPRLERLDLTNGALNDEDIKNISRLPHLRCLIICGTSVTDEGFKSLAALPKLEAVSIARTQVTANAVRDFMQLIAPRKCLVVR